jgi:hypothetical protein
MLSAQALIEEALSVSSGRDRLFVKRSRSMLSVRISLRLGLAFIGAGAVTLALGCGGRGPSSAEDLASPREALEAALTSWQKGESAGQLAVRSTPVHAVDHQWLAGVGLERFEIRSEEESGKEGDPDATTFTVTLALKKPAKETQARYVVVGTSPVWVYREEDFQRLRKDDKDSRPASPPAAPGERSGSP